MSESDNILDFISSIEENMNRVILSRLRKKGIQGMAPTHGRILIHLHEKSHSGEHCQMNELAERIRRKKNTVTTLVGKLEEMQCVETHRSSADKRVILVRITEKGEKIRETFEEVFGRVEDICRGKTKPRKAKELLERLGVVLKNLERKS